MNFVNYVVVNLFISSILGHHTGWRKGTSYFSKSEYPLCIYTKCRQYKFCFSLLTGYCEAQIVWMKKYYALDKFVGGKVAMPVSCLPDRVTSNK